MATIQQFSVAPIKGKEAVLTYPVGIGQGVFLFDFDQGKFWLKQNYNGYEIETREFDFSEVFHQEIQNGSISRDEFDTLSKTVADLSNNVSMLVKELGGMSHE